MNSFKDVSQAHWAYEYVEKLHDLQIVNGNADGNFYPDASVTRAEFAQMMKKAMGLERTEEVSFTDVNSDDWYYDAVVCLAGTGLIKGYEDNSFKPNDKITREDMAVILFRAISYIGNEWSDGNSVNFTDKEMVSEYAVEAVERISNLGLLNGFPDGSFGPFLPAARAEVAAVIYRALDTFRRE